MKRVVCFYIPGPFSGKLCSRSYDQFHSLGARSLIFNEKNVICPTYISWLDLCYTVYVVLLQEYFVLIIREYKNVT